MTEVRREQHPDWIWPRADSHVVLSADGSPDVFKVFVEPGGSFSPGVGSFGVTVWVHLAGEPGLVAPERLGREQIRDRLLGGILPIHRSRWRAGPLELDLRLGVEACPDRYHPAATLWLRATSRGEGVAIARVYLVVRSMGPAGGPIHRLAFAPDVHGWLINDQVAVIGEQAPDEVGCCSLADDSIDISVPLQRGRWPVRHTAADRYGYCGGALGYALELPAGASWEAGWTMPIRPRGKRVESELAARCAVPARERIERLADEWREGLERVKLSGPDGRVVEAFGASLTHLVMAAVGGEPRVAPVCYPMPWVRDGVYAIHAMDVAGLHERARAGLEVLARQPWAGGFGAEADAPGQLLWALEAHHRLTSDEAWLADQYAVIAERAECLVRMRRAREPIYVPGGFTLPRTRLHADGELLCEPARAGLIVGRVDWHRPLYWVNHWALAGLRGAARMAAALGHGGDAGKWADEAAELADALAACDVPFGDNDRDTAAAIWPTGAREPDDPETRDAYEAWWRRTRLDELGRYRPEPRWRYFELGQAHNLLRLGFREQALLTLEHFLRTQDAPGLYGWAEGDYTGDPNGDWRGIRGWWPSSAIVPHGWASAEMALLVRDLYLYEEGDALVVGAGLRHEWLTARDDSLAIEHAPTWFGPAGWTMRLVGPARRWQLVLHCTTPPPGGWRLRLPLPPSAQVELYGTGIREEQGDWPIPAVAGETTVTIDVP